MTIDELALEIYENKFYTNKTLPTNMEEFLEKSREYTDKKLHLVFKTYPLLEQEIHFDFTDEDEDEEDGSEEIARASKSDTENSYENGFEEMLDYISLPRTAHDRKLQKEYTYHTLEKFHLLGMFWYAVLLHKKGRAISSDRDAEFSTVKKRLAQFTRNGYSNATERRKILSNFYKDRQSAHLNKIYRHIKSVNLDEYTVPDIYGLSEDVWETVNENIKLNEMYSNLKKSLCIIEKRCEKINKK